MSPLLLSVAVPDLSPPHARAIIAFVQETVKRIQ
jgi:hypothetical protein